MEALTYSPSETPTTNRKAGFVDILIVLWMWSMLFLSFGPKSIQARFHYVPQLLTLLLIVFVIARYVMEEGRFRINVEVALYAAWGIWAFTGLLATEYTHLFWPCMSRLWKLGGMFLLICWAVNSEYRLKSLILIGLVGGTLAVTIGPILGIGQYHLEMGGRETGALGNPNSLAYMSELMLCGLLFAIATVRSRWIKLLSLACIPIPLYLGYQTGSRNAFVGIVIVLLTTYFFYMRPRLKGRIVVKLSALIAILLIIVLMFHIIAVYSPFAVRFESLFEFLTTGRSSELAKGGRGRMFMGGLRMTLDYPILGAGLGHDYPMLASYTGLHPMFIHSDLAGLGGMVGIPGLILFYSIGILLFVRTRRITKHPALTVQEKEFALFCLVFLACYLARTVYDALYCNKITWVLLGGITGYVEHMRSELRLREAAAVYDEEQEDDMVV